MTRGGSARILHFLPGPVGSAAIQALAPARRRGADADRAYRILRRSSVPLRLSLALRDIGPDRYGERSIGLGPS